MNNCTKSKQQFIDVPIIVLAGGKGTRLRSVVSDKPKILAPINGVPFISILLSWLENQGATDIIFSLGYEAQQIIQVLDEKKNTYNLSIRHSTEPEPLGTLGGLSYALSQQKVQDCIVINGDTFVDVQLSCFLEEQRALTSFAGLVTKCVDDTSRYGRLAFKDDKYISSFIEKDNHSCISGWINAGIYYLSSDATKLVMKKKFGSIEIDFLSKYKDVLTYYKAEQGRFIDIGTPESYEEADNILKEYIL